MQSIVNLIIFNLQYDIIKTVVKYHCCRHAPRDKQKTQKIKAESPNYYYHKFYRISKDYESY